MTLEKDIKALRTYLIERVPTHFGTRHVLRACFGALLVGLTFTLKGQLFTVSLAFTSKEIISIIIATIVILTAEIYFVGYKRVKEKAKRKFGQFWAKRFFTYYLIAIIVSIGLVDIYGLHHFTTSWMQTMKLVVAVSFPSAIGAAAADLLEKY